MAMPELDPIPVNIEVPKFDVSVPDASIDWAYDQYAGLLLAIIDAEMEGVFEGLDNFWSAFAGQQATVWAPSFDLVSAMGYTNPLRVSFTKELAFHRGLYEDSRAVLQEAARLKNLELYITTRFAIEKQKQAQYNERKTLELAFAKDCIEKSVEQYNAVLKVYEGQIAEVKAHQERINVIIEQNDLRLKIFAALIQQERSYLEMNRAVLAYWRAEVAVQQALLEVAEAQIEAQKIQLRCEALEIEILRLQIEAQIKGTEVVLENARQADIQADIDIIAAQIDGIRALQAELKAITDQVEIVKKLASEKIGAYSGVLAKKRAILGDLQAAQMDELQAEASYVAKQVEAARSEIDVVRAEGDSRIAEIEARTAAELRILDAQKETQRYEGDARIQEVLARAKETLRVLEGELRVQTAESGARLAEIESRANADSNILSAGTSADLIEADKEYQVHFDRLDIKVQEYFSEQHIEEARSKVAEILAKAKIINRFTEHRE